MHAADLKLEELVEFSDGFINLHGRRLVLHDIHALAQLRGDLVRSVGDEAARRILTRFGRFWGEADAAAMQRIFEWDSLDEWLLALARFSTLQGVAKAVINNLEIDHAAKTLRMEIAWHGSAEAEEQLIEAEKPDNLGCRILDGYASGYASFCLGKPVYFVERSCRARGDSLCVALGQDSEAWGAEAASFRRYYQEDDIKGRIERLTAELRRKNRELRQERQLVRELQSFGRPEFAEVRSKACERVIDLGTRVARFDSSVLITGESGVGKEVLARFIHRKSLRGKRAFVAVNCGALPETLLESELFGHKAGSFTGAVRDRLGLFEEAQHGTLLLDEIGDVSADMQVKLLRVLQEKEIRRVGENVPRPVDVRVIAATNRRLAEEVRRGRFREDLFYRLSVVEIHIPPLRERPEDILPMARFLTQRLARHLQLPGLTLDATALGPLQSYPWPGNVRELENALERAAVVADDRRILPQNLPAGVREAASPNLGIGPARGKSLADMERSHIMAVLREAGGNRTHAAEILGIGGTTLWRKLKSWGYAD
jgi:DNA-binding NtrC family response regulator/predicted hydrocarbon binding protein